MAARQSVARPPDLLPARKQAGVVDAGGQGLCMILEGIWHYVRGEVGAAGDAASPAPMMSPALGVKKERVSIEEEFGYEVVFLLRGEKLDVEKIRQTTTYTGR